MDDSIQRDSDSMDFWAEYVVNARAGYRLQFDHSDTMRVAINECFTKIDKAIVEANASGCNFFDCRQSWKEPQKLTLLFSDGKEKTFRRSLKIDARFNRHGAPLERYELINLKIALQSMILNEGKVRGNPKTVWIS